MPKPFYRKSFAVFMSVCMLIMSFFLPIRPASAEVMNHQKYQMDWSYSNTLGKPIRTELIMTANNVIAYCMSLGLKSPSGHDLPENGKTDDVVYRVLLNGYPQKTPEQLGLSTWEESHYATQLAVWNAQGSLDVNELTHTNKNVERVAKAIIQAANASQETQDMYMNVVPVEKQKAELVGEYFQTNLYTVETNAKGSFHVQTNNAPNGVKIVNENGEAKDSFSVGEKFRLLIPKNNKTGEFSLKVISNLSKLQAVAFKGTDVIQDATVVLERSEEKVSADFMVNWESKGSLLVKKVGEQGEPLAGAVFDVFNDAGEKVTSITTGNDGIARLHDLPSGHTYKVKEVKAPEGYVLSDEEKVIEVQTASEATVSVTNKKIRGNLSVLKTDEEKKPLQGVEFTVFDGKKEVAKAVTDQAGKVSFENLPYSTSYFVQETKAPQGFVPDDTKYPFQITENGKTVSKHVINKLILGKISISKMDDGKKPMKDVTFIIYNAKSDKEVARIKTNKDGIATSDALKYGDYYFKEATPEGYVKNDKKYPFSITENGKTLQFDVMNRLIKADVLIKKQDENGTPIEGVEFTLYDRNDKEIKKVLTGKDGTAHIENLEYGTYSFRESKTLPHLVLNDAKHIIKIQENGKKYEYLVTNKIAKANVRLVKVDQEDKNKKLAHAVYELQDGLGKLVGEYTTNENGEIVVENLPFGDGYKFIEKQAPAGYVLSNKEIPFSVKKDGETISLEATNKKIYGSLYITKVDVADGKLLPNAKFEIYQNEKVVVSGVTDSKGLAKFERLPAGKYTYREVEAPNGYKINETIFEFEIKTDGEILRHKVEDEKVPTPEQPVKPQPSTPERPTPEQPVKIQPNTPEKPTPVKAQQVTPEQSKAPQKVEGKLPETGGKDTSYLQWIGLSLVAASLLGAVYALKTRKNTK
ncbi:SpaA isopeptide-forming pilin-related protein [Bacillus toyonensis]|uniref:SpaA isopeptide-forming pilin-related protein n=1 Tax=Bacillus toyonensis TaxID=155322 RepID=UPI000BF27DE8|nr:SpaA isopeptide-forming pilin-related protein [Bacillus toyonensis]PGA76300.1 TQXA domain-containing protein [Bacillus toyonensis]